ncbi:MAG: hypothetical protein MK236_05320 [Pedosphaera sp.]|nr:hypothetical protein [Pedosphaera sp.]
MGASKQRGKSFLALFAAGVAATVVILIIQNIGINLYPPPEELKALLKSADKVVQENAFKELIATAPIGALWLVLLAYAVGTTVGGWLAARMAPHHPLGHAALIGACLLGGGIINFALIPHPTWMVIIGVLIFIPSALLGAIVCTRQSPRNATGSGKDSGEPDST